MSDVVGSIPFPSLMDELVAWSNTHSRELKARRVYDLCIKRGKIRIAILIRQKYRSIFQHSDLTMAFEYSLMARKQFLLP